MIDIRGPRSLGGTTFSIHLHVGDVDTAFERAVRAGASVVRPLQNHFYGERSGTVRDPFGHEWLLGGQLESVTPEEMQRRYTALFEQ
jgi:PhnB protein